MATHSSSFNIANLNTCRLYNDVLLHGCRSIAKKQCVQVKLQDSLGLSEHTVVYRQLAARACNESNARRRHFHFLKPSSLLVSTLNLGNVALHCLTIACHERSAANRHLV